VRSSDVKAEDLAAKRGEHGAYDEHDGVDMEMCVGLDVCRLSITEDFD